MRIAFSSFVLQGGKSGVSTYIMGLLKGLQNVDQSNFYDIFVNRADKHLLPPQKNNFREITFSDYVARPIPNILWHNTVLPFYTSGDQNYDVIHIPTIGRIPFVKRTKIVATVHDLAPMVVPNKYNNLHLLYHKHVLARIIHRCDRVIAVSQSTKNDIIRFTGYPESKISLIYLGINNQFYHPLPKEPARERIQNKYLIKDPFLLYVSRIEHPGKNHIRLIKAFEKFKKLHDSPYKLVIIGADWNGANFVHEYADKSSQRDNIKFLGFVPLDDVRDFYNTCDLLVFPSLYEGFGLPILEAMACGTKVICSRTSSLAEIAEGYAEMFDPESVEDIYTTLDKNLQTPITLKEQMRNIEYASTFDWNAVAKKVVKVYESV